MPDFDLHETPEHITDMIYQAMLGEQVFVTIEGRRIVYLLPLENGRSLPDPADAVDQARRPA